MRTTTVAAGLCVLTLLLVSCGSGSNDSDAGPTPAAASSTPSAEPTEEATPDTAPTQDAGEEPTEEATAAPSEPEAVVQQWFAAQRAGDAAAVCALEAPPYQAEKYGEAGQACLDDAANNQPQTVWADPVVIVSLEEGAGVVTAVVQPNASTPDEATVQLLDVDGSWLVGSFA